MCISNIIELNMWFWWCGSFQGTAIMCLTSRWSPTPSEALKQGFIKDMGLQSGLTTQPRTPRGPLPWVACGERGSLGFCEKETLKFYSLEKITNTGTNVVASHREKMFFTGSFKQCCWRHNQANTAFNVNDKEVTAMEKDIYLVSIVLVSILFSIIKTSPLDITSLS